MRRAIENLGRALAATVLVAAVTPQEAQAEKPAEGYNLSLPEAYYGLEYPGPIFAGSLAWGALSHTFEHNGKILRYRDLFDRQEMETLETDPNHRAIFKYHAKSRNLEEVAAAIAHFHDELPGNPQVLTESGIRITRADPNSSITFDENFGPEDEIPLILSQKMEVGGKTYRLKQLIEKRGELLKVKDRYKAHQEAIYKRLLELNHNAIGEHFIQAEIAGYLSVETRTASSVLENPGRVRRNMRAQAKAALNNNKENQTEQPKVAAKPEHQEQTKEEPPTFDRAKLLELQVSSFRGKPLSFAAVFPKKRIKIRQTENSTIIRAKSRYLIHAKKALKAIEEHYGEKLIRIDLNERRKTITFEIE
jgi:hypothetical protein